MVQPYEENHKSGSGKECVIQPKVHVNAIDVQQLSSSSERNIIYRHKYEGELYSISDIYTVLPKLSMNVKNNFISAIHFTLKALLLRITLPLPFFLCGARKTFTLPLWQPCIPLGVAIKKTVNLSSETEETECEQVVESLEPLHKSQVEKDHEIE